jgi:succinate-semialdehyde dehydrogenase / glutarate-semialdehyde dehydrogenase
MAGKKEKVANRKLGTLRARTKNLVPSKKGVKNMKTAMVKHKTEQKSTRILSINPYTEEIMKKYALMSTVELNGQVGESRAAFLKWRVVPVADRAALMAKLAAILRAEKRNYAELITKEMGKPIKESLAEVEKCAVLADYYAANTEQFLKPEEIRTEAKKSYVMYQPLGIVLAVMPWNFPFWQVIRFAVPALVAGNVALLKHASNVPMTAIAIEEAFARAGFPDNVFKTVLIDSQQALGLIDDDMVDAVSLTGSNKAGEDIGAHAGRMIKKVVLELGGSDPYIVLDDADVEKAGRTAANARMINTGQSCIAAKRFIVMESAAEEFTKHFLARLREMKLGDPMDETTDIGTVARKDILDGLKEQLRDAKVKGATVLTSGQTFTKGLFFTPSIVLDAKPGMKVLSEEVFGPIAPIIIVKSDDEAIAVANDTQFGLGAAVWSRNIERAERLAGRIEAGTVTINDMVKSDPRLPFGGVKKSGVGREMSHHGLKEFVNVKTIVVRE